MKKLLVVGALCAISALGAYASFNFPTSCGIDVQTVDLGAFSSDKEAGEFYDELDELYCPD